MGKISILHFFSVDKENYYLNNLADHSDPDETEYSFVTMASPECDFVQDLKKRGRTVFGLNCLRRKNYPRAYRMLSRLLREIDPDIVHTHLFDPSLIGLTVAKRQQRKTVLTRHHSDALHELSSPIKRRFYLGLENYISGRADHIIAPSRMVRECLVDREGVSADKVSVIPYGQTTERFDAITPEKVSAIRDELGMGSQLSMVCVSRLFHRKGHKYLFEAFAKLKGDELKARLYLVGDGNYRAELEALAASLGILDDIAFLGWRDDALAIVAASDLVVHPSLEDALSSAVIEALMLERPIVATDISGVRDSLADGKFGKIVAPADADAFRKGIDEVLADIESARKAASSGRKYLLEYMDAGRVARCYADVYRSLLVDE
ncbi:MAG: glycosyltransferase family 4 protein [Pyrinomonadaceae bacterium]